MKLPLSWLDEFVTHGLTVPNLCRDLTMAGLQIDAIEERGKEIAAIRICEILHIDAHPKADRLTVCTVSLGADEQVQVVCGAKNMTVGDRVPFAPPGCTLPGGVTIATTEIRGVRSSGMLCSAREVGLAEDAEGLLILSADAPIGTRLVEHLKIEETVLEVAITPNRGDCVSVLGMAREVSALSGRGLRDARPLPVEIADLASAHVKVRIEDPRGCGRYAARVVRNLRVAPSPAWMQRRLEAAGVRPINNVVDVTNYVMIERGQPLHAFDLDLLPNREIVVRRAGETKSINTLDGKTRALAESDLLISTGEQPIAVAGVMGGADSEVSEKTTTILLESAWFEPSSVRRTKKRLDLGSEAAFRFERGVDPEGVVPAINRAAQLLHELAGGEVLHGVVDEYPGRRPTELIPLRVARCERILGVNLTEEEIVARLTSLGAQVTAHGAGRLSVAAPSYRSDLSREIDLIEEVARLVGYARIEPRTPAAQNNGAEAPEVLRIGRMLSAVLNALGMHETIPTSFAGGRSNRLLPGLQGTMDPVRLLNPINLDETEMRQSLLPALLAMWELNRSQGSRGLAAFALNKVFWRDGGSREAWRVSGILAGTPERRGLGAARPADFADVKGVVEAILDALHLLPSVSWRRVAGEIGLHPGKSAEVIVGDACVGRVGALHPEVEAALRVEGAPWLFELDVEELMRMRPREAVYSALPRFPEVVRDIALVADADFASGEVRRVVMEARDPLVQGIELFDQYSGPPLPAGKKNLAYSITYRAGDRTLTDDEVGTAHRRLVERLTGTLPVELRG